MLGCIIEAEDDDLAVAEDELADARWFEKDQVSDDSQFKCVFIEFPKRSLVLNFFEI